MQFYFMVTYSKELSQIKEILKSNPQGMTITDLSKRLNIYRKTTAKYLDMLLITGQVEMRPFGPVKIYTSSRRIPISKMLNMHPDGIMILDRDLRISQLNSQCCKLFSVDMDEVLGLPLQDMEIPFGDRDVIFEHLLESLNGKDTDMSLSSIEGDPSKDTFMETKPVTFDDGSSGVMIRISDRTMKHAHENLIRRKDTLLKILSHLAIRMPDREHFPAIMDMTLKRFGDTLELDRTYLNRKFADSEGNPVMQRLYEWLSTGTSGMLGVEGRGVTPFSQLGSRLLETLLKGKVYFGHIKDFLPEERLYFESQEIISIALVPIFSHGNFWGCLGFDRCEQLWEWASSDIDSIKVAAELIGHIIEIIEPEAVTG
jgi:hypothetical protein